MPLRSGSPKAFGPIDTSREGRDPENSVILVDHATILNLLLTTSKFTFGNTDLTVANKEDMMSRVANILKEKLKGGVLNFSGKNFIAEPYEILSLDTLERVKYSPTTFKIDEDGILYNEKGEKVTVFYSVRT
ncbi:hypothetical protein ES703_13215 [subsurface metagenome]